MLTRDLVGPRGELEEGILTCTASKRFHAAFQELATKDISMASNVVIAVSKIFMHRIWHSHKRVGHAKNDLFCRVYLTPHVAGVTELSYRGMADCVAEEAKRFQQGLPATVQINQI